MISGKGLKTLVLAFGIAALVFFLASLGLLGSRKGFGRKPGKIARIDITGPILSSGEIIDEIKKHRDDKGVAAILFRIDSPGGAVTPSQEIFREILKTRQMKGPRVVASIGSLGASGGYYIASAAQRIYASPGSLVGSIGVILELTKFQDLFRKIGIDAEVIKSGPYKDIGSPLRRTTPEERALLQGVIDDTHRQFIEAVAEGRNLPLEKVKELADGRIFTGAQARELGLVDELGGLEEAIEGAARLSGIEGKPEIIKPGRKWGWRRLLESTNSLSRRLGVQDSSGLMYLWSP